MEKHKEVTGYNVLKKGIKYFAGIATMVMAILISASCNREEGFVPEIPKEENGRYRLIIAAGQGDAGTEDPATRAFLNTSNGFYDWTPGDKVGLTIVPTATPNTPFLHNLLLTADCSAQTYHTTFTGTFNMTNATAMTGKKYDYYSYFPYNASLPNTFPNIQFQIPGTMVVQPNVFDPNLAPMVADRKLNENPIIYLDGSQTSGNFLHFNYKHLMSYAAIEMDCRLMSQQVTSITITNNNGTQLWGTYSYNMTTGTGAYSGGSSTITVNITGGLTVGGGNILYIPMPPVNMSGQSFTFQFNTATTTPCKYINKTIQGVNFQRGVIHHLRIAPYAVYDGNTSFTISKTGYYYIEAWGGNGGSGGSGGSGGASTKAGELYQLNAGDNIYLYVGVAGNNGSSDNWGSIAGTIINGGSGGSNGSTIGGGGSGGNGRSNFTANYGGGGGGGGAATFIMKGGTTLSNLILASGGGGGGGGSNGGGGGTTGATGGNGNAGATGGGGGTNTAAGSGGAKGTGSGNAGSPGNGSSGGNGGSYGNATGYGGGGGGGGGGYYAGGGGGANGSNADGGAGGGGGANYSTGVAVTTPPNYTPPTNSRPNTNGYVVITFFRP